MPASPPAAPTSPASSFDAKVVVGGDILHSFANTIARSPWVGVVLGVLVLTAMVRSARGIAHGRHPKDPVRRFSQADRRLIFARAGNRCEHHFPIFGRCRTTTGLEADHVHPHSRGGWTSVSNGQALCKRHNREKSARVPWNRQLNNLAKRRASYFTAGHDPVVVRHRPQVGVGASRAVSEL